MYTHYLPWVFKSTYTRASVKKQKVTDWGITGFSVTIPICLLFQKCMFWRIAFEGQKEEAGSTLILEQSNVKKRSNRRWNAQGLLFTDVSCFQRPHLGVSLPEAPCSLFKTLAKSLSVTGLVNCMICLASNKNQNLSKLNQHSFPWVSSCWRGAQKTAVFPM